MIKVIDSNNYLESSLRNNRELARNAIMWIIMHKFKDEDYGTGKVDNYGRYLTEKIYSGELKIIIETDLNNFCFEGDRISTVAFLKFESNTIYIEEFATNLPMISATTLTNQCYLSRTIENVKIHFKDLINKGYKVKAKNLTDYMQCTNMNIR